MECKKCGKSFSARLVIDGKVHNIQRRKYCLECSPFNQHNTRTLEGKEYKERSCRVCGKSIHRKSEKGYKCWVCTNKQQRESKIEKIKILMGGKCCLCGYNKCWHGLDCHHVDEESKLFNITSREVQYAWERILTECKKCILVCCRCHREIHAGLVDQSTVQRLWRETWDCSTTVVLPA